MSVKLPPRRRARAQALQLLFQQELRASSIDDILEGDYALSDGPLDAYAEQLARGCAGMQDKLNAVIARLSKDWPLERMPVVDRNLLRLALYEMLVVDEVDVSVAIDEAVELAHLFGTDDSARFINGILGVVARECEAGLDPLSVAPDTDTTETSQN